MTDIAVTAHHRVKSFFIIKKQRMLNSIGNVLFLLVHAEIIAMTISKFSSCANKKFIIHLYANCSYICFFIIRSKGSKIMHYYNLI